MYGTATGINSFWLIYLRWTMIDGDFIVKSAEIFLNSMQKLLPLKFLTVTEKSSKK